MGASTTDKRDIYYRQSKTDGYRARSAYKLLHLDEIYSLFHCDSYAMDRSKAPTRVVDLCAAPGSWSQVLTQKLPPGSRIVAVDLQPMAPIPGVINILGDITRQETADAVVQALRSDKPSANDEEGLAQLIVCDGAPDVTGVHDLDEYLHAQLMLAATQITLRLLEVGGTFIAKIFTQRSKGNTSSMDESGNLLTLQFQQWFEHVDIVKPRSSRPTSVEHFLVCRNFRPPFDKGFDRKRTAALLDFGGLRNVPQDEVTSLPVEMQKILGMTACGDLSAWDAK
ncbi:FtsJ-domain-containing protein [Tilletiaria anomala UBC 951]|uniref:Putative tRNA (cytidine(32)/guanosine(34)-2'-O)-methyltransferase n=1 Tax=Tilletiaria anomala (strain ATCC 24038 / CBS 436.72 / UBC 951) TaxID=1037660 RepID=A0A066WBP2_TILAU|nr:FtsJ-domain-containing protein [Tilletiaria anomala UBC 951]KDN48200.1 FtsJ-domain-containing protein [Tilletiaria anomala UBC 951]